MKSYMIMIDCPHEKHKSIFWISEKSGKYFQSENNAIIKRLTSQLKRFPVFLVTGF